MLPDQPRALLLHHVQEALPSQGALEARLSQDVPAALPESQSQSQNRALRNHNQVAGLRNLSDAFEFFGGLVAAVRGR
jgi:hypothetical protein